MSSTSLRSQTASALLHLHLFHSSLLSTDLCSSLRDLLLTALPRLHLTYFGPLPLLVLAVDKFVSAGALEDVQ